MAQAILEFNLAIPQDVASFTVAVRGREYLEAILTFGSQLRRLTEEGRDIVEALETFNQMVEPLGIHAVSGLNDLYDDSH